MEKPKSENQPASNPDARHAGKKGAHHVAVTYPELDSPEYFLIKDPIVHGFLSPVQIHRRFSSLLTEYSPGLTDWVRLFLTPYWDVTSQCQTINAHANATVIVIMAGLSRPTRPEKLLRQSG